MKNFILYNPLAGHGNHECELSKLEKLLEGESVRKDIREIDNYKDFLLTLKEDDRIVLCGGDGTINRFVNDTDADSINNEILYYAIGTGNDFLHDIDTQKAEVPFRINEYIKNLPTVEVNGKCYKFINGIGYGIDGYCCEEGDKIKEKTDNPVNYTSIAIKGLLFHYKRTNAVVTVDGVSREYNKVWLAPVMNGRFYGGGMMMAPNQDRLNKEHLVSSVVLHHSGKLKTLMVFPSIFKGEHTSHTEMVDIHTGREITVKFDKPTALQIDGETIIGVTKYTVRAAVTANII